MKTLIASKIKVGKNAAEINAVYCFGGGKEKEVVQEYIKKKNSYSEIY